MIAAVSNFDAAAMPATLNRRRALGCCAALGAGLFTALGAPAAQTASLHGWRNPCRGALPPELARHDIVLASFEGLDARHLWDVHAHLLGTGDAGSGCSIDPHMHMWWHPADMLPGVMPLYSPDGLAAENLLAAADVEPLQLIREHNPLLFDFVLKRRPRWGVSRLPRQVFETRAMFERGTTMA